MIATEHLSKHLAGFNVIDCEVCDRLQFYLLARLDYTQNRGVHRLKGSPAEGRLQKRVLVLRLDNPDDKKWGVARLDGLDTSCCSMAFAPEKKLLVVDSMSKAWAQHSNTNGFEVPIRSVMEGGELGGAVMRAKSFGAEVMICTLGRQLFQRLGVGAWERIGPIVPYKFQLSTSGDFGFEDFDRFSETDWYAAGGLSDVWQFDGSDWRQCAFPSNQGLFAVCCAGDGEVYLSVGAGSIYRGKGDRWKRIHEGQLSIPIKDLVWYEGQVWGTSDYGLWTVRDGVFAEADVPPAVKVCAGNLATRDGVLLVAGYGGAAFKRDGQWTTIFHDHELRQAGSATP